MSGGSASIYNLYELTATDAMQAMKQSGKIAVSPYYPTNRERRMQQQCESQIATYKQQCDREKAELSSSITPLKTQISALRQDVSARDNAISQLQRDLQNAKQNKNVSQLVATLKDPVTELSRTLRAIVPGVNSSQGTSSQPSVIKKLLLFVPIVNFLLLVMLIVLWGLILDKQSAPQTEGLPTTVEVVTDTVSQKETEIPDGELRTTDGNATDDSSKDVDEKKIEEHLSPFRQKETETPKTDNKK